MSITGKPRPKVQPWNPTIKKSLQDTASKLPPLSRMRDCKIMVSGEALKNHGVKKDKSGNDINPKAQYAFESQDLVNHYEGLRTAYLRYGIKGVEAYKREVIAIALKGEAPKKDAPEGVPNEEGQTLSETNNNQHEQKTEI